MKIRIVIIFLIDMSMYQVYNKNIQKDEEEWHYGYF